MPPVRPGGIRPASASRPPPLPTSGRGNRSATACDGSRRSSATTSWTSSTSTPGKQLPESLTGYIQDRTGYDYLHHAEVGSSNAGFVTDDVVDRFCVIGAVEEHVQKLLELRAAGVDQFNLYLMNGDEEAQLEAYGRDIIPAVNAALGR